MRTKNGTGGGLKIANRLVTLTPRPLDNPNNMDSGVPDAY